MHPTAYLTPPHGCLTPQMELLSPNLLLLSLPQLSIWKTVFPVPPAKNFTPSLTAPLYKLAPKSSGNLTSAPFKPVF